MMKKKISIIDAYYYIQGHLRYWLYYSKLGFLMRRRIHEQITCRINSMNRECYDTGSCIKCGCKTTHLQMANKACDGKCYPKMLNKKKWKLINQGKIIESNSLKWKLDNSKFIKVK